jgi:hypothetical protein
MTRKPPPERLTCPDDLRLRSVSRGGPSDLEVWLEANPQHHGWPTSARLAELSDMLYQLEADSGFNPTICAACDDLLAAVAEAGL